MIDVIAKNWIKSSSSFIVTITVKNDILKQMCQKPKLTKFYSQYPVLQQNYC